MEQLQQNKEFIIRYFNAVSGAPKIQGTFGRNYMTDEELLGHIAFFEKVFPRYEVISDEMTAEGNRVVVRARGKELMRENLMGYYPRIAMLNYRLRSAMKLKMKKL